jgi:hypothetical protein
MLRHLLIMRLTIFNVCCAALVVYAYKLGYVATIFQDAHYIPHAMTCLFLLGLISTFIRGWKVSRLINGYKATMHPAFQGYRVGVAEKALIKQSHIYAISDWLVYAALIGTAIGILVMVPDGATAEQMHAATSGGLRIALPATIMGFILALWTSVNFQMLDTAVRCYIVDVRK